MKFCWSSDSFQDSCELDKRNEGSDLKFSIYSVAGSSATIYAYVSEFHCCRNRSKILIFASVINGAACNYLAIVGYFLLNRDFSFHVPLVDVEYKPWRMYLFACGLPSFFCAIGLMFFPESPKFLFSKVRQLIFFKHLNFE